MIEKPKLVELPRQHKELGQAEQDVVATLQIALERARNGDIDGVVVLCTDPTGRPSIISTEAIDLAQLSLAWDCFKYELLFVTEED